MPRIAIGLSLDGTRSAIAALPIRIVPIDAYEAYAVAPHATLGAVALT